MTTDAKLSAVHEEKIGEIEVVQTVHQDGTVDYVDTHAVGGDLAQMPEGYYQSIQFVGTVIVSYPGFAGTREVKMLIPARLFVVLVSAHIWDGFCLLILCMCIPASRRNTKIE